MDELSEFQNLLNRTIRSLKRGSAVNVKVKLWPNNIEFNYETARGLICKLTIEYPKTVINNGQTEDK